MFHRIFSFLEGLTQPPKTTALEDAISGLADAEKQALTEETMAEYSAAQVICHKAMSEFQRKRIEHLQNFIHLKTGSTFFAE